MEFLFSFSLVLKSESFLLLCQKWIIGEKVPRGIDTYTYLHELGASRRPEFIWTSLVIVFSGLLWSLSPTECFGSAR